MKILVNAVPLANLRTGIARYVEGLYRALSRVPGVSVAFYDGSRLLDHLPGGPADVARWSLLTKIFWALPTPLALAVRMVLQHRRERKFLRLCAGFDIYHETSFFPFKTPRGIKTVLTVHDLGLLRHPYWHPAERVQYFRKYFVERLGWAHGFLAVSRFTRDEMCGLLNIPREQVQVSLLGVDAERFAMPKPEEVEAARAKYGLPKEYFLCVGSGDPRKNIDLVLAALRQPGMEWPLARVGWEGWDKAGEPESGEIRLGYVQDEDLPALYAGALAFVYPSLYEGFGLPILEAMACGCPVVTTRLASLPEVAADAALYLEDPENAEELALLLRRVAESPALRGELRAKGLARAQEFSWDQTAEATLRLFQRVLAEGPAPAAGK
jgi:alpha-1,3-rhamnosyl/mannosyltransferase